MMTAENLANYPKRATLKETAEILGMSVYAVDKLCKQGVIPFIVIGRRKFVIIELAEKAIEAEALENQRKQKEAMQERCKPELHMGRHYPSIKDMLS